MFSVLFEVNPHTAAWEAYLDLARRCVRTWRRSTVSSTTSATAA
jgi:hypothetical protein